MPSPAHHPGYHLAAQSPACTGIDFSQHNVVPGTQSRRIAFVGVEMQLHSVCGRHAYDNITEDQATIASDHGDRYLVAVLQPEYIGVGGTHMDVSHGANHT